jgi:hypothetical protein
MKYTSCPAKKPEMSENPETELVCLFVKKGWNDRYGPCSDGIFYDYNAAGTNNDGIFKKGWGNPLCKYHGDLYPKNSVRPFSGLFEKPETNPNIQKYEDPHLHKDKENQYWFCSDGGFGGIDGTLLHWGTVFKLNIPSLDGYNVKFACENHMEKWISEGWTQHSYGTTEQEILCAEKPPVRKVGAKVVTKEKIAGGWTVRTQKAKGILALRNSYFNIPSFKIWDAEGIEPSVLLNQFVRPCPMRPRHGFVDSRKIQTLEEAEIIIKETLAADPDAEFVTMPFINASFSGIWTPGHLAIGLGNDGATAGKTAITIPALGDLLESVAGKSNALFLKEKANIQNAPYVELLWNKQYSHSDDFTLQYVQLRDGPILPSETDYIPEKLVIQNIIVAEGDLLEWEEKMKHVPPNTVVDHVGGSLASHYAIHAVLNKVPVLISKHPETGQILEPTQTKENEIDIQALRAGFALACNMPLTYETATHIMLAGCHHVAVWRGKFDLLLGLAMGCGWRLTVIASLGEARHYRGGSYRRSKAGRDQVYEKAWKKTDTQYTRLKFMQVVDLFLNGNKWPSGSFGGRSWYKFAVNAVNMYNALVNKNGVVALESLNQLVHSVHNNGWGFNKFINEDTLDKTAKHPVSASVKCASELYQTILTDTESLKSAARTFWKRHALAIPENLGTGGVVAEEEEPEHEDCNCSSCEAAKQSTRNKRKLKKPQPVNYAQAFFHSGLNSVHVQWKSDGINVPEYFTKDVPVSPENGKLVLDLIEYGEKAKSLSGSEKMYTKLYRFDDIGWCLINAETQQSFKLLELEEKPYDK